MFNFLDRQIDREADRQTDRREEDKWKKKKKKEKRTDGEWRGAFSMRRMTKKGRGENKNIKIHVEWVGTQWQSREREAQRTLYRCALTRAPVNCACRISFLISRVPPNSCLFCPLWRRFPPTFSTSRYLEYVRPDRRRKISCRRSNPDGHSFFFFLFLKNEGEGSKELKRWRKWYYLGRETRACSKQIRIRCRSIQLKWK